MEHLREFDGVLAFADGERPGDEDEHAARGASRLAVDSDDAVGALLEGEGGELGSDGGGAHELLALEGEHGALLVQPHQRSSAGVKRAVVVLHERLRHSVGVHLRRRRRR